MKISELFYSIQGEGKRAGKPSFFIRTNFCNLRCGFAGGSLCDTPYTSWNPDDEKNAGDIPIEEIISGVMQVNCRDIVITGGEPAMYAAELEELAKALKESGEYYITLETNGTYWGGYINYIDLVSVSPKLKSSVPYGTPFEKMHEKNRLNIESLQNINEYHKQGRLDVQWKFVFTGEDDIEEILELRDKVGFANRDIYLMPEGTTREQLDAKRLPTIEACIKHGFNYTDRLHILAWGDKRGV
jgi:7-carboxy-7-deazaguanine synthase